MVAHNAVNQALLATAIGIIPFSVVDVPECLFEHTFLPFSYFEFFFWKKKKGLGTEYFRTFVQSNCGVSVLDFTPHADGGSPYICLNRLNQVLKKIINNFLHCLY